MNYLNVSRLGSNRITFLLNWNILEIVPFLKQTEKMLKTARIV